MDTTTEQSVRDSARATHNRRDFALFIAIAGLTISVLIFFALDSLDQKLSSLENSVTKSKDELLSLRKATRMQFGKTESAKNEDVNLNKGPSNRSFRELVFGEKQELSDSLIGSQVDKPITSAPALADTVIRKDTLIVIPQSVTVKSFYDNVFDTGKPVKVLTSRSEVLHYIADLSNQTTLLEDKNQALLHKVRKYEQELAAIKDGRKDVMPKSAKSNNN